MEKRKKTYFEKIINTRRVLLFVLLSVLPAFAEVPAVTNIAPANGNNNSSTTVTINGTGFYNGGSSSAVTEIKLDDALNTSLAIYNVASNTVITATVPSGIQAGTFNVKVTTAGGTNTTSTQTFEVIDNSAPISVVVAPVNGTYLKALPTISGTATDETGISNVKTSIKNITDTLYWDGASSWGASQTWIMATGSNVWGYVAPSWTNGKIYVIQSKATDTASNAETPSAGSTFIFDDQAPSSTVTTPVNGTQVSILVVLAGTASDATSPVATVKVAVKNSTDNFYWSGGAWVAPHTWLNATGTNSWSLDSSSVTWSNGKNYLIQSKASDGAGNDETPGMGNTFLYNASDLPAVTNVVSNSGSNLSPATITITGTGYFAGGSSSAVTAVKFDDISNTVLTILGSTITDTEITTVFVPPGIQAGTYNVLVTTSAGTNTTSAVKFIVTTNQPAVFNVEPAAGSNSGPTTTTITGMGFFGGTVSGNVEGIKLDDGSNTAFTSYSVYNDTTLLNAIIPAGVTAGTYNVLVKTGGGSNPSSGVKFVVTGAGGGAPIVTNVTPGTGGNMFSTTITVTGTGFYGGVGSAVVTDVKLDDPGSISLIGYGVVSDTILMGVVPSGIQGGSYNVKVTTPGGTNATSAVKFVVTTTPPGVQNISPSTGSNSAPTTIMIDGDQFYGGTASANVFNIKLNDGLNTFLTGYTVISNTVIQNAIIPSGVTAGTYSVKVTTGGGTNATSVQKFVVTTTAPTVASITPIGAFDNTSANALTIFGTGFFGGTGTSNVTSISVNGAAVTIPAAGSITDTWIPGAIMPPGIPAGTYNISVTTESGTGTGTNLVTVFSGGSVPTVVTVSPSTGNNNSSTTITVTGTGYFGGGSSAEVTGIKLDDSGNTALTGYTVMSDTALSGAVPPGVQGGTYNVLVTTPGGTNATGVQKFTVLDNTFPSSAVTYPATGSYLKALVNFTGTATDETVLNNVKISIRNTTDTLYWDGGGWSGSVNWLVCTGTTNWTFVSPGLTSGKTYIVVSKATDNASNTETPSSAVTFIFDSLEPVSAVVNPANGSAVKSLSTLSGIAADSSSGVALVKTSIRDLTINKYWNGVIWDDPAAWVTVTGTTNWTYIAPVWVNEKAYEIKTTATDVAGNVEIPGAGITFLYDNQEPASTITYPNFPTTNTVPALSGTASDNASTVVVVSLNIYNITDTTYWTGGAWAANTWVNAIGTSNWTFTGPTWATGKQYIVRSKAKDGAGNEETTGASYTFWYDDTPPASSIFAPANGVTVSSLPVLSGGCSDATSGLQNMKIMIKNVTDTTYWNGAVWDVSGNWLNTTGINPWNYSSPAWISGNTYLIKSKVDDTAGNQEAPGAGNSFIFDSQAPTSAIVTPANGVPLKSLTALSGTATDSNSVTLVQLSIKNITDTTYWTGSVWGASTWVAATGTNNWSYSAPAWTSGNSYGIQSKATDNTGNVETPVAAISFIYDTTTPSSTVTQPVNGSSVNGGPASLLGTASDNITVGAIGVSIKDTDANKYYNGADWSSNVEVWLAATGTTSWSKVSPAWTDGVNYLIRSKATDAAGNVETPGAGNSFVYFVPVDHLDVYGIPDPVVIGTLQSVTVMAKDAGNNQAKGYAGTVTFTSNDTDSRKQLPANYTFLPGSGGDNGVHTFTNQVKLMTVGSIWVRATDTVTGTITGQQSLTVNPDAAIKLQLLVPGEVSAPIEVSGKTGTPSAQTAGSTFNVTVNCTDQYYNKVTSANPQVQISTSDLYDTEPAAAFLTLGAKTYSVTLVTAGTAVITATDLGSVYTTGATSNITVNGNIATRLQLLLPGETAAAGMGTGTPGKTGTPSARTAGAAFNVTVNCVDDWYNKVTAAPLVEITTSDINAASVAQATLVSGTRTFSVTLLTAGVTTITATDVDGIGPYYSASASPAVTVNMNIASKLQLLLPGETAVAGTPLGKTGIPSTRTTGASFNVTVNCTDNWWNIVTAALQPEVLITTSDLYDAEPVTAILVSSTKTFSVTPQTSGSVVITATDTLGTGTNYTQNVSPSTAVDPGTAVKLQLLVPGEIAVAGMMTGTPGKTGTPSVRTEGTAFNVTVNCVDVNWNKVVSANPQVQISTNDPFATAPASAFLVAGTRTYNVTLVTAGTAVITATDLGSVYTSCASPNITVNTGAAAKLQVLVPGETAVPGSPSGKTGTPDVQVAGTGFVVTVNCVDANWNKDTAANPQVQISTNDPNDSEPGALFLSGGTKTFSVTAVTAGTLIITATDLGSVYTANATPNITVDNGAAVKLQLLVPGETAVPGSPTGKTGTPAVQVSGASFVVTVNCVDANWNKNNTANPQVQITTSDTSSTEPAPAFLTLGTRVYSVTLVTAGTAVLTATDLGFVYTLNASPNITVNTLPATKLQLLVPGETAVAGMMTGTPGKTGTPTAWTAGTGFIVTVNCVDANWNKDITSTPQVRITTNDLYDTEPAAAFLVAGTNTYNVTFVTAGTAAITAVDLGSVYTADISPSINVNNGTATKLQLLLPGEAAVAGKLTGTPGKAGTPSVRTAGTAFNVTVNCVDNCWNIVTGAVQPEVIITTSELNDSEPAAAVLAASTKSFAVTLLTAGSVVITAADTLGSGTNYTQNVSPAVTVNAGPAAKLNLFVPGEVEVPGEPMGKTGTPSTRTVGVAFAVTVNCVDDNFNKVTSANPQVKVSTNDLFDTEPAPAFLTLGTRTFNVTLITAGTASITAADLASIYTTFIRGTIPVNGGSAVKLQLLVPGEGTLPGSASGKTGTAGTVTAGTAFTVTVNSVDAGWNKVTSSNPSVSVNSSDLYTPSSTAVLASGTGTFVVTLKTAGVSTLTAADAGGTNLTANTSPNLTVNAGAAVKLQLLTPGEAAVAGSPTGKAGVPSTQTAGTAFAVTVNCTDANWNKNIAANPQVQINTNDLLDTEPAPLFLAAGTKTFNVTFMTAGTASITAADQGSVYTLSVSPVITVNPPIPVISVIEPLLGYNIYTTTITISGTGYFGGGSSSNVQSIKIATMPSDTNMDYSGAGISNTVISGAVVPLGLPAGIYDIKITTGVGTATSPSKFTVMNLIAGKVTTPDNLPIAAVSVELKLNEVLLASGTTDVDGKYRISAITAGEYSILASAQTLEGYISSAFQPTTETINNMDFQIAVTYSLGEISGVVPLQFAKKYALAKAPGKAMSISGQALAVELWQGSRKMIRIEPDANGNFKIPNLLSGNYAVKGFYGDIEVSNKQLTVHKGEKVTINLAVEALQEEMVYNFPNPISGGVTTFKFTSGYANMEAEIKVFNLAAELIRTITDSEIDKTGSPVYRYDWNCTNNLNEKIASGVYIYQITAKDKVTGETKKVTKKMAVIK